MRPPRLSVKTALRTLVRIMRDPRGATAIEYGLIAAIIVVGLIASIGRVGNVTSGMWNNTNAKMGAVTPQ